LTWDANHETDVEGYHVYRGKSPNQLHRSAPINSLELVKNTSYIDEGLEYETTYYYAIKALDEVPNESGPSDVISILTAMTPVAPQINNSLYNFNMKEDSINNNTIRLYHWFKDENGEELEFRCEGQKHINVTIYQKSGSVALRPEKDWNGQETLTFFASDGYEEVSASVKVTITYVNDPPIDLLITRPKNNTVIKQGEPIDFIGSADDVDMVYGDELTFSWSSNKSGWFGEGVVLSDMVLPSGIHEIKLKVKDNNNANNETFVILNITSSGEDGDGGLDNDTDDPDGGDDDDGRGGGISSTGLILIMILMAFLMIIIFLFNKKGSHTPLEKTQTTQGPDQILWQQDGFKRRPIGYEPPDQSGSILYPVPTLDEGSIGDEGVSEESTSAPIERSEFDANNGVVEESVPLFEDKHEEITEENKESENE